jgi:hypothetical protein
MRFSIELTWFFAWRLPRYRGGFASRGRFTDFAPIDFFPCFLVERLGTWPAVAAKQVKGDGSRRAPIGKIAFAGA